MITGRLAAAAAGVALVSACGGTTTTYAPNVYPALTTPQALDAKGQLSAYRSATLPQGGTANDPIVHSGTVTIDFTSATTADVSIAVPGQGVKNYSFVDQGGGNFLDTPSGVTMDYELADLGGSLSDQMVIVSINGASGPNIKDVVLIGNNTLVRDLPNSAGDTAVNYTGRVTTYDGAGTQTLGNFALTANFVTDRIDGTISNVFTGPLSGATFSFSQATISSGTFRAVLVPTGATQSPTQASAMEGTFFGPGASQVGGIVRVNTTTGSVGGVFAGVKN